MKDLRTRTGLVLSAFALILLVAACAQSPSTPEESAESTEKPAEAAVESGPQYVTVSVPAGTELEVELLDSLSSGKNQVGDAVRARLANDLLAGEKLVATAGAELQGSVTEVVPLKKFGGQPKISVAFESIGVASGDTVEIVAWLSEVGKKQAARDAAKIGGGAAAGAVVGHQVDDDKGAEIGAVLGGAIGTVIAAKTGKEVELKAGTMMLVTLEGDVQVRVED